VNRISLYASAAVNLSSPSSRRQSIAIQLAVNDSIGNNGKLQVRAAGVNAYVQTVGQRSRPHGKMRSIAATDAGQKHTSHSRNFGTLKGAEKTHNPSMTGLEIITVSKPAFRFQNQNKRGLF